MKMNGALNIIRQELKKSGLKVSERNSVSTSSVYFDIKGSRASLLFRVSDHKTYTNVITLRVDHKLTEQAVRGFVKNRIMGLQKRDLNLILGM